MVNLRPGPLAKAKDLHGRSNGRKNIEPEKVQFKEVLPLALKNRVRPASARAGSKACTNEMMAFINCLSKFNGDKNLCGKEMETFNKCYERFKASQAEVKNQIPVGQNAKLSGDQITAYLAKFPQSSRKTQDYVRPEFRP